MTQTTKRIHRKLADAVVVEVAAALTTLGTYDVSDMDAVSFHIANADVTFDQFVISAQFIKDGAFETLYSAAGDYTTPAGLLIGTSGDLTAIANGATGWFVLYPKGLFGLRIAAASSGANTTTTVNGGGS